MAEAWEHEALIDIVVGSLIEHALRTPGGSYDYEALRAKAVEILRDLSRFGWEIRPSLQPATNQ